MTVRSPLRFAAFVTVLLGTFPAFAAAAEELDPSQEFALEPYIPLEIGPLDLSINKAVIYMALSSLICIGFGLWVVRKGLDPRPGGSQNVLEVAYEFSEEQIARQTLSGETFKRYFPYVATLFLFVAVNNIISFIPLPMAHAGDLFGIGLKDLGLYAATANINVTVALAALSFVIFNYEGVRAHGAVGYVKSLVPEAPGAIKPFIFVLELLSTLLRLVSLSVRLFANLLAGHLLIIMCAGFVILLGSFAGLAALPVGAFFYVFEVLLVAGLQAFIFAMLTGLYIGFAVEAGH